MTKQLKPQMKQEVALNRASEESRSISFYATPDASGEFREYGRLEPGYNTPNLYWLRVDARFDFGEVVSYIVNYGK